ncbi:hypothetical protein TD95_003837 [Thielaviopsis punctulata]|uniref:Sm domain-containing protein n=1 Tax=Thielaviopsis punctulata TaxID=72032 RepID=A0A0F4Z782_9PEZI|nr:hypothetical protein TD95_003837 [Thielaviopsis punctulata]
MADRGNYRGGGRGGSRGDYRGGRGGGRGGHHGGDREQREPKKRDNILDLAKYMDKAIRVKFTGGREGKSGAAARRRVRLELREVAGGFFWVSRVSRCGAVKWTGLGEERVLTGVAIVVGTLKGYDALMNLVLDEAKETMSDCVPDENGNETERQLGLLVARGTLLVLVSPLDGSEVIENPFLSEE